MPNSPEKTFVAAGLPFSVSYSAGFSDSIEPLIAPFVANCAKPYRLILRMGAQEDWALPDLNRIYSVADAQQFLRVRTLREKEVLLEAPISHPDIASAALGFLFALALATEGGLVLHASASVIQGRGYVFVGPSGAGKSTVVRNASGALCINDDRVAVRRTDEGWIVAGVPLCDNAKRPGLNVLSSLAGLYFLKKGEVFRLSALTPRRALPDLLAQTIMPFSPGELARDISNTVLRLVSETACHELTFSRHTNVARRLVRAE